MMHQGLSPEGVNDTGKLSFVRPFQIDTKDPNLSTEIEPKKKVAKRNRINTDLIHNRQTNDLVRKLKASQEAQF